MYPPPRRFSEFSNEQLAVMASQGVTGAFKERLLREIMRCDGCSYGVRRPAARCAPAPAASGS